MSISFSQRVSVKDDVLFRELDGESVLLNLDNETYYGLDEVGTRIWELLSSSPSVQQAFDTMLGEYDVQPEQLREDLQKLIQDLTEQGLIQVKDVATG